MLIKFYEQLLSDIRDRRSIISGRLLAGNFDTFEEYKKVSGKFNGLEEAEQIIKNLYKDMFDSHKEVIINGSIIE